MAARSRQPAAAAETKSSLIPILTLEGHKKSIPSISYFQDGKRMISVSGDETIRRWDLEAGKEIEEARKVCQPDSEVLAVEVSRDGRWVVTGGVDNRGFGELRAFEIEKGIARTFEGHSDKIDCIDISTDSTLLASGSYDLTVRIWNLDTGNLVAGPFKSIDRAGAVRFSQDSKRLAVQSAGKCLEVWNVQSQKLDVRVGKKGSWGCTYAPVFWTTKNNTIVAVFSYYGTPTTIYEFDASTLDTVGAPFEGHAQVVTGLALSFDCALLASASMDRTIKLWAFESRQLLASVHVQFPYSLIFSPNSHKLAYTTWDNTSINVCDIPPDILASIQATQQVRISAPGNPPLAASDLSNPDVIARPAAVHHNPKMDPSFIALPPPLRRPSPTIGSQLHYLFKHPRKLLTPSFHTGTHVSNDQSDDLLSEAVLQDLSQYITKDGDYPVARGGFGEIWKCTYHIDQRSIKVAVKALQVYAADQFGTAKTKKIKRIKRELRICATLEHANILPVYGYTHGFGPFIAIVSPWAENGNLIAYLEREDAALTLVRRFRLLRDIIAGLQYLHANNVIHGDFNGSNVLIHGDGTACVADFGLSLMYSEVTSASQASWTSTIKGNMRWMAPELLVPEREDGSPTRPSEQSDIFSFGGIMLQVLTNKVPYYYLPNDAAIVLCIARSETPSRPRYPELPDKYWEFIERCWSTNPRDRPSTEGVDVTIRNEYNLLSRSY